MREALLKCVVKPGMFSDEKIVTVTTVDGKQHSFFVEAEEVRDDDTVRVEVVERDGIKWVTLPTDHPYNAIPVRGEDIIEDELVSS